MMQKGDQAMTTMTTISKKKKEEITEKNINKEKKI